jgi:hypothetical protein
LNRALLLLLWGLEIVKQKKSIDQIRPPNVAFSSEMGEAVLSSNQTLQQGSATLTDFAQVTSHNLKLLQANLASLGEFDFNAQLAAQIRSAAFEMIN